VDATVRIDGQEADVRTLSFEPARNLEHRRVLHGGDDDVVSRAAIGALRAPRAFDREIIALGTVGGENDA